MHRTELRWPPVKGALQIDPPGAHVGSLIVFFKSVFRALYPDQAKGRRAGYLTPKLANLGPDVRASRFDLMTERLPAVLGRPCYGGVTSP